MTTPTPGPLADEAARLFQALADMAGGTECQVCPVCQLLGVLRRASPETFGHLVDASASLAAAMRTMLEGHGDGHSHHPDRPAPRPSGVSRINLDEPETDSDWRVAR